MAPKKQECMQCKNLYIKMDNERIVVIFLTVLEGMEPQNGYFSTLLLSLSQNKAIPTITNYYEQVNSNLRRFDLSTTFQIE